ncbi:MAG: c-type cytochrome [Bauldia sp.]|nr:c-type cytochrome [Bauldia sp.]
MRRAVPIIAAVLLASTATVGSTPGEAVTFTAEQAAAGAVVFNQQCVGCHDGSDAPVLTHPGVWSHWAGRPAYRLYDFITQFMPADRPGILPRENYVLAMAHLLQLNGMAASDNPLSEDVDSLRRQIAPLARP